MNRSIILAGFLCICAAGIIGAQEIQSTQTGTMQGLRGRALILDINARVLENENVVIWSESHQKTTFPGNPVGIQLVGSNVVVAVQFTPFIRRSGNVLVAQGQIWISDPVRGVSYYTSIQTIPMEFGEPFYFFPLGTANSSIELMITVNPFNEGTASEAENNN